MSEPGRKGGAAVLIAAELGGCFAPTPHHPNTSAIHYSEEAQAVVVHGLSATEIKSGAWTQRLAVHTEHPGNAAPGPPVAGRYRISEDRGYFRPVVGWSPGIRYHATWQNEGVTVQTEFIAIRPEHPLYEARIVDILTERSRDSGQRAALLCLLLRADVSR